MNDSSSGYEMWNESIARALARSLDGEPVRTRRIYIRTDRYHLLLMQGGVDQGSIVSLPIHKLPGMRLQ